MCDCLSGHKSSSCHQFEGVTCPALPIQGGIILEAWQSRDQLGLAMVSINTAQEGVTTQRVRKVDLVAGEEGEGHGLVGAFCNTKLLCHGVCCEDCCAVLSPCPHPSLQAPPHKRSADQSFEASFILYIPPDQIALKVQTRRDCPLCS